jgi:hypothetical protein
LAHKFNFVKSPARVALRAIGGHVKVAGRAGTSCSLLSLALVLTAVLPTENPPTCEDSQLVPGRLSLTESKIWAACSDKVASRETGRKANRRDG